MDLLVNLASGDVAADVRQNFRRLQGWRIRGVRWDRYDATGMFLQHGRTTDKAGGVELAPDFQ